MLKEALALLVDLGQRTAKPETIYEDAVLKRVVIDGRIEDVTKTVPPRAHTVGCLAEIVALANRFADDTANPVVWYDESRVVLVIDDPGHRVNVVTLPLAESDIFGVCCRLREHKPWHEQKAFVRLLRVDLAGTLDPGVLLNGVRKVSFSTTAEARGTVTRERESMGREINSSVAGQSPIPETVTLRVPVYRTAGERQTYGLNCAVEIDHEQCRFQLLPLPDEIERVQHLAMESISARLVEGLREGVPCYYGKP